MFTTIRGDPLTPTGSPTCPEVTAACKPRHRHQEFLAFLKQVASAYPDEELHLVMDN